MSYLRVSAVPVGLVLFFGLCLLYLSATLDCGLSLNDEGLVLCGAERVLDGDVPYRDFWSIYPPGQFYVAAAVFKTFGKSVIAVRYLSLFMQFALVLTAYLLARRLVGRILSLCVAAVLVAHLASVRFWASPVPPAILFSLLTCLLLSHLFESGRRYIAFLSGMSCGIAALFRHDFGGYLLLCSLAILAVLAFGRGSGENTSPRTGFKRAAEYTGLHILGILAIVGPAAVALLSAVPWEVLKSDLIDFPGQIYPGFRELPYPAPLPDVGPLLAGQVSVGGYVSDLLGRLPYYLPILAVVAYPVVLAFGLMRRRLSTPTVKTQIAILLVLMCLLFLNQARVRSDFSHVFPALVPGVIVLAYLVSLLWTRPRTIVRVMALSLLVGGTLAATVPALKERLISVKMRLTEKPFLTVATGPAEGIRLYRGNERYFEAVNYIKDHVPPRDRIFVGSNRHDCLAANDMMFYFLAQRRCATRYHELSPGLVTTAEVQNSIIAELERYHVEYLVLAELGNLEPNESGNSSGVVLLDDYIRSRYVSEAQFGGHTVWRPISDSGSADPLW